MTNQATKFIALGENIKKARKRRNEDVQIHYELADLLNISREHLAKIETAKRGISLNLLFQMADILEVPEKDLFDFELKIDKW